MTEQNTIVLDPDEDPEDELDEGTTVTVETPAGRTVGLPGTVTFIDIRRDP